MKGFKDNSNLEKYNDEICALITDLSGDEAFRTWVRQHMVSGEQSTTIEALNLVFTLVLHGHVPHLSELEGCDQYRYNPFVQAPLTVTSQEYMQIASTIDLKPNYAIINDWQTFGKLFLHALRIGYLYEMDGSAFCNHLFRFGVLSVFYH